MLMQMNIWSYSTMEDLIKKAIAIITESEYIVAFTGAGVSTESGIPDFRSKEGIWKKYDPYEYGSYEGFLADPAKYWTMAKESRKMISEAEPNAAHTALAILENEHNKLKAVITQNIDYLHSIAGNSKVIELHGTYQRSSCMDCQSLIALEDVQKSLNSGIIPPRCQCGVVIKNSSILFGESLPEGVIQEAKQEINQCDCLIVIGSSLSVFPANLMPFEAAVSGSKVIIINDEPTRFDYIADVVLRGKAALLMSKIIHQLGPFVPSID